MLVWFCLDLVWFGFVSVGGGGRSVLFCFVFFAFERYTTDTTLHFIGLSVHYTEARTEHPFQ